ncbi:hypothetical protein V5799_031287 [Amblyomma americanum]|uniref:Uncharacterized protein n=1 Tax=Amblyomma americanum TaxID=6943 RepID=A0AAQ4EL99_AMBAM
MEPQGGANGLSKRSSDKAFSRSLHKHQDQAKPFPRNILFQETSYSKKHPVKTPIGTSCIHMAPIGVHPSGSLKIQDQVAHLIQKLVPCGDRWCVCALCVC